MKNVVLITVDCLRADHMGCYGYSRDTTPFLDKIANRGLFFENCFANGPNTRHSVPSFLSSTYPLLFLDEAEGGRLHPGRKTIAEVVKEKGFTTVGVHSNPYISKFYGYDRGFDFFNDFLVGQVEEEKDRNVFSSWLGELWKGLKAVFMKRLPHETGECINEEVFSRLEGVEKPFFLWVHYMDVHMPYVPPDRFLKELGLRSYSHIRKIWMGKKIDDVEAREDIKDDEIGDYVNLYDGCIRYNDWIIEELISRLEKEYPDTVFVVTADHGEEFREHGGLSHMEKLYDELLHVPLIFYGDDVRSGNVDRVVSLISLMPTVLDILNVNIEEHFSQGKSMFDDTHYAISEVWKEGKIFSYRDKKWKFIFKKNGKELYNIKEDPSEENNLYLNEEYNKKVNEIEDIIKDHIENIKEGRRERKTWIQKQKIKKMAGRLK